MNNYYINPKAFDFLPDTSHLNPMRLKADLLLLMVAVIWGTAFVAQGIAGQYGIAYLFNGVSFMLAAIILMPFIPRGIKISHAQWGWMLVAGVILFFGSALQQVGLLFTKVANAGFLTSLYTVFTPFLLWIGFLEKPHKLDMIAVAMAAVGAFLLSTAGRFELHTGDALEVAGSLFWAFYFVVLGKFASKFESISFAAGHFFIGGFLNFAIGFFVEDLQTLSLPPIIAAIAYRASLSIGIGYTLQVWGQKHTPPTDAALILGLEAVFAVAAAWLVLNQTLLPIQIIGCVVILIAVLISQVKIWNSSTID
ncbi:MAG: DMT family transporter, partial [Anaerolineales bacterium]|nr:DMT family transporter [Anaerolineales bacterium]